VRLSVGKPDGESEGWPVGLFVGSPFGSAVGFLVSETVVAVAFVGEPLGFPVGLLVGYVWCLF